MLCSAIPVDSGDEALEDGADSELSDEAVIDTLVAGCGGASGDKKKSGGCCVLC